MCSQTTFKIEKIASGGALEPGTARLNLLKVSLLNCQGFKWHGIEWTSLPAFRLQFVLEAGITPVTVKILKFGTPQTIAMIVLKIEKFDVTLH